MADAEDVGRIARTLPVTDGAELDVNGKGFAWFYQEKVEGRKGRVERRDVLAIRVAHLDEKEFLILASPEKFFTVPHYNGFPAVLARLPAIGIDELTELLTEAWRIRAPKKLVAEFDAKAKANDAEAKETEDRA